MKQTRSKSSSHCLFCFRNCFKLQFSSLWNNEIPGAVHCATLKRQLQNLFILRNILDIDTSWCEETLRKRTEAEEEFKQTFTDHGEDFSIVKDDGNLEFWFKLCQNCVEKVEQAWKLYQELLGIQTKLNVIKKEIKDVMKEGIMKNMKRDNGTVEDNIRKLVFPDLELGQDFLGFGDDDAFEDAMSDDDNDIAFVPPEPESGEEAEEMKIDLDASPNLKKGVKRKMTATAGSQISKRYKKRIRKRRPRPKKEGPGRRKDYKLWICDQCHSQIRDYNPDQIRIHQERHQKSDEAGGGEFDCPQCTFPAQDARELQRHIHIRHVYEYNRRMKMKNYECCKEGCEYKSRTKNELMEHTKELHPELVDMYKTHLCSQCPKVFICVSSLNRHVKADHPELVGEKFEEVQCDQCDRKFTTKLMLQYHVDKVHNKTERDERYVCDDCGEGFRWLCRLKTHQRSHQTNLEAEFICNVCGVDFIHKNSYSKHMRKFHGGKETSQAQATGQEAIHKCRYCEFETPFLPALRRHVETHSEEVKGFVCEICSRRYTSAQGLNRHKRINHSQGEFPCPYCNKKYASVDYMKDHVKKYCKMKELKDQEQQQQNNSCSNSHSGDFKLPFEIGPVDPLNYCNQ